MPHIRPEGSQFSNCLLVVSLLRVTEVSVAHKDLQKGTSLSPHWLHTHMYIYHYYMCGYGLYRKKL